MRQIFISVAKIMHLFLNNAAMRLSYLMITFLLFYSIVQSEIVLRSISKLMPTFTVGNPQSANLDA